MAVECGYVPFWQLFEEAARAKYGYGIEILSDETPVNKINFAMTVIARDNHPHEATRTVVDIHTKDYVNRGREGTDETNIRMSKVSKNSQCSFTSTRGIDFGFGSDIGAKVIGLAVGGESTLINAFFNRAGNKTSINDDVFTYYQEEKIKVPPGHSVTTKITTYSTRYDQDYTLKFSVPRDLYVPLVYRNSFQQCFFCVGTKSNWFKTSKRVFVRDIIHRLPGYNGHDVNNTVSFTQRGTLSWVGGGSCVNKVEQKAEAAAETSDGVQIVHSFHTLSPKPKASYTVRRGPKKTGANVTFEDDARDGGLRPGGLLHALSVDKITRDLKKGLEGVRNCRSVERVAQALKSIGTPTDLKREGTITTEKSDDTYVSHIETPSPKAPSPKASSPKAPSPKAPSPKALSPKQNNVKIERMEKRESFMTTGENLMTGESSRESMNSKE